MKGLIPYGGIQIAAGAATQALSTSAAQLTLFSSAGGSNGPSDTFTEGGDPAVKPDYANNRVLVDAPGVYEVTVDLCGTTDATQNITLGIAKNGVAVSGLQSARSWTVSVENAHSLSGFLVVSPSDNPGTIATNADPATSVATGRPAGGFGGGGGFPKNLVPLTILLTSGASTPTLTIKNARFNVKRVG